MYSIAGLQGACHQIGMEQNDRMALNLVVLDHSTTFEMVVYV